MSASGDLYYDDGDSLDTVINENYFHATITMRDNVILYTVDKNGYDGMESLKFELAQVVGLTSPVVEVFINGISYQQWEWKDTYLYIGLEDIVLKATENFNITIIN